MSLGVTSVAAFVLMVAGLFWLILTNQVFAKEPLFVAVQVAAVLLMIWARIVFGRRSFHAAANPTAGGIVTTGPYRVIRHPIYAAVLYFIWAAALDHRTLVAITAAVALTIGAVVRMLSEEHLLVAQYPEYAAYKARTARVVPYLI